MNKGVDADSDLTAAAGCLKAAGIGFVCRYINRMSVAEATHLSAEGLYIVSTYETSPTSYGYFSAAQGVHDANEARDFAHTLGQSIGTPIYFTVDYDASPAEAAGEIAAYFGAIRETINANGNGPYKVGVYGNGEVLKVLTSLGLVEYRWLSMSTDWSGSAEYSDWDIKQTHGGTLCGHSVDFDVSTGNAGGWNA